MDTKVDGPDALLGRTIAGRYTIMRRIARGGMGVVYLAVQEGLARTVALKIIRKEAASDPVMQKRFEREARAVSQLGHPSIVTVYDFGRTDDGELFLAMEFVDGEVLRDAIKRKTRLTFQETLPIVECIASALSRAHGAGVVHRDLKPENVMLPRASATTVGAVAAKVLDFGLAKAHDPDLVGEHLTREGGFIGTPGYASPEQAEGAPEHPRQDLYSLGVVWFELLVGEHPFAAATPMKTVVRQLNEDPPLLDAAGTGAPPAALALIRRLMARRPEDRPESARAVLEEIASWRASAHAPHDVVHDNVTVDERGPRSAMSPAPAPSLSSGHAPAGWFMGAVVVAALAAAVVVVAVTRSTSRVSGPVSVPAAPSFSSTDAGAPVLDVTAGVDVVIAGVPSFTAMQALRASLPASSLQSWSRERAVLHLDDVTAPALAEILQGTPLMSELPLVLEVSELSPGKLLVTAVRPDDATALKDAGFVDVDSGMVVVPGGLSP